MNAHHARHAAHRGGSSKAAHPTLTRAPRSLHATTAAAADRHAGAARLILQCAPSTNTAGRVRTALRTTCVSELDPRPCGRVSVAERDRGRKGAAPIPRDRSSPVCRPATAAPSAARQPGAGARCASSNVHQRARRTGGKARGSLYARSLIKAGTVT